MTKFKCDTCGDIDHVLIDGYAIAERLLEGVKFEIRWKAGASGGFKATAQEKDYPYFKSQRISRSGSEKDMGEYAGETDFGECPLCGRDVDLTPWDGETPS